MTKDSLFRKPQLYGFNDSRGKQLVREDPERCIAEVWYDRGFMTLQCKRKRGYGKDGLYCKQHANHCKEEWVKNLRKTVPNSKLHP